MRGDVRAVRKMRYLNIKNKDTLKIRYEQKQKSGYVTPGKQDPKARLYIQPCCLNNLYLGVYNYGST